MIYRNKVSIVIPTYGRPELLSRAINSVLAQTYKNVEIIVVDDNCPNTQSRIETEKLLSGYLEKGLIYLKHAQNKNGAAARNTGLKVATGDYITFLDDDDEMLPNRVEICVAQLEDLDNSWGACYTDFKKIKADGTVGTCGEDRSGYLYVEVLMRALYLGSGSNLFLRTKPVRDVGGYDEDFRRNQDVEFAARFAEKNKIVYIPTITFKIHYEDSRRNTGKVDLKKNYERLVKLDEFYLKKFDDRIKKLHKKDQQRVYKFIALERFRWSIINYTINDGFKNCIRNHIGPILFARYGIYMLNRFITKKTYGFRM